MARAHLKRWIGLVAGLLAVTWVRAIPAAAQCALCYTSAAATGERGAAVLRVGILVLLIPTLLTFAAVLFLTLQSLKRRDVRMEEFAPEKEGRAPSLPGSLV